MGPQTLEMIKQIAFILIIALRLVYNPYRESNTLAAFAKPVSSHNSSVAVMPGRETEIHTGCSERLILKWIIGDNRPGECFRSVKEIYEFPSNEKQNLYVKSMENTKVPNS